MITANFDAVRGLNTGADDYVVKPCNPEEIKARVNALLRRARSLPFGAAERGCTLSLSLEHNQRIGIRCSGSSHIESASRNLLDLELEASTRKCENALASKRWRFESKEFGRDLYGRIFADHRDVLQMYKYAQGQVGADERLHVRLKADRSYLRAPLEFLYDAKSPRGGDYLALLHPMSRCVDRVIVAGPPLGREFLNDLVAGSQKLKILLIASNTSKIPGADREIACLKDGVEDAFDHWGIEAEVRAIPTADATYSEVQKALRKCDRHVVHYAGHGHFDAGSPERSCLQFWEQPGRRGAVLPMTGAELDLLLRGSDVRFVYLSCCYGTTTGPDWKLLDDDFLGIADSIIHAGVPSVLGFRRAVSDEGAIGLATAFYESLARYGQLDTALLEARKAVYAHNPDDITWLSPILIQQA